jgi:AAA family ATP:ADP antiporter
MTGPAGWGLQLRPGERRPAALMGVAYFLLLLFYYLLKPARDSLFLVEVSAVRLPWVYMLTALVAAPVTAAWARAGRSRRLDRLLVLTSLVLAAGLLLLRELVRLEGAWVLYVFYAFTGVAGGLVTSQFWLLANAMFDASQAKRIFPALGIGGIAGAFAGGEIAGLLVRWAELAPRDLMLVAAGVLASAAVTVRMAGGPDRRMDEGIGGDPAEERASTGIRGQAGAVLGNPHLRLTVGIITLTVMAAAFVDYIFKTVSVAAYPDSAALTVFLGRFYGRMSLVALAVQLLLATPLIRRLGAGGVILVLPVVLGAGAAGVIAAPGLLAGMLLRGGDLGLKYSLDRTSRELLYLPVPLALKKRTKVFIDVFVDRWARGLAGLLLLAATAAGLQVRGVAVLLAALLLVWFVMALRMRAVYLDSFRRAVARREIDLDAVRVRLDDTAVIATLVANLEAGRLRDVVYALQMLEGVRTPELAAAVRPLLASPAPEVRSRALRVLARAPEARDHETARALLDDDDPEVRAEAVAFVLASGRSGPAPAVLQALLRGRARHRSAALAYLDAHRGPAAGPALVDRRVVAAVLQETGPYAAEGRAHLAALPWLPAGAEPGLWTRLLDDPDTAVVAAAMAGVGRRGDVDLAPRLLEQLQHPRLRVPARAALARLAAGAPALLDDLEAFFRDGARPARVRAEVPRVLADVPLPGSVTILLRHLATHDPELRYPVLKALGRLRARHPRLRFDADVVAGEIGIEAGRWLHLQRYSSLVPDGGEASALLRRTIGETQQLRLESVFRLLALVHPPRDVHNAYLGLTGRRREARANAREFLGNLLTPAQRRVVLPLIDGAIDARDETARTTADALAFLGTDCDPWLAACAIHAGGDAANPAAACHLTRQGEDMLTPIEKVLLLQKLDVFSEVPTDQLAALAAIAREVPVLAGDRIYERDDSADALYLVLEGAVRLQAADGAVIDVGAGRPFGVWALFDDEPRAESAVAAADARLLRVDAGEFADLLADDARFAKGVIRTIARRLRTAGGQVP